MSEIEDQKLPADSAIAETIKPPARSRVGNGSAILEGVDGRSLVYRRYRDVLGELIRDAFASKPTEAQQQLARRAASLSVWCESEEAKMANGEEIDIAMFSTVSNTLRRLLADIGLGRIARDATPSLAAYLAKRDAARSVVSVRDTE